MPAGERPDEAWHLPELAAPRERRSRPPLCRDGGAGAPDPLARLRLDLGRRASRHARASTSSRSCAAAAPRRRGRGAVDRHQRQPAAAAQPGRAGRGRRIPGRDHGREIPARRRPRLSARGVPDVRRAHARAGEPVHRGRRDHPAAVERGPRHAPRAPLAVHRCQHPAAPAAVAAAAHHHRRAGGGGHQAGRQHRRWLAAGADPHARPAGRADVALHFRAVRGEAAALPAHLQAARSRLRCRRQTATGASRPT